MPSSPNRSSAFAMNALARSPSITPSTTTWATWMPLGPNSRARLCAVMRRAAFAAAKEEKLARPRKLARRPSEDECPPLPLQHPRKGCLRQQKRTEGVRTPVLIEDHWIHLKEGGGAVSPGIVNRDAQRT